MASEFIYKITIYRVDQMHMDVFESDDKKATEAMYKALEEEWTLSTAEKRPFRLPPPELHSMLPSLIFEIKVEQISKEEHHKQSNPYHQQMNRDGVGGIMNQNFNNGGF